MLVVINCGTYKEAIGTVVGGITSPGLNVGHLYGVLSYAIEDIVPSNQRESNDVSWFIGARSVSQQRVQALLGNLPRRTPNLEYMADHEVYYRMMERQTVVKAAGKWSGSVVVNATTRLASSVSDSCDVCRKRGGRYEIVHLPKTMSFRRAVKYVLSCILCRIWTECVIKGETGPGALRCGDFVVTTREAATRLSVGCLKSSFYDAPPGQEKHGTVQAAAGLLRGVILRRWRKRNRSKKSLPAQEKTVLGVTKTQMQSKQSGRKSGIPMRILRKSWQKRVV
jgi:hypothetical protein